MDMREYYAKIREVQQSIAEPFVVVVSKATNDGGKAGVASEVSREVAARLVVDDRAVLAPAEAAQAYREAQARDHQKALEGDLQSRIMSQFSLSDWEVLRSAVKTRTE